MLPYDPTIEPSGWLVAQAIERKWPGLPVVEQVKLLTQLLSPDWPRGRLRRLLAGDGAAFETCQLHHWFELCRVLGIRRQLFEAQALDLQEIGQVLPSIAAMRKFVASVVPMGSNNKYGDGRAWWKYECLPALIACGAVSERKSKRRVGGAYKGLSGMRLYSTTERILGGLRIILEPDATYPELRDRWRRYRIAISPAGYDRRVSTPKMPKYKPAT